MKAISGFSLIEVVVTTALAVMLVFLTVSPTINFSQSKVLDQTREESISIIQDARQKAATGTSYANNRLGFGVVTTAGGLMQFATASDFASRITDFDYEYSWPDHITASGFSLPDDCVSVSDCVIFGRGTGAITNSGWLALKDINSNQQLTIAISANGLIYGE